MLFTSLLSASLYAFLIFKLVESLDNAQFVRDSSSIPVVALDIKDPRSTLFTPPFEVKLVENVQSTIDLNGLQYHGTTTLAFIIENSVIVACDSMASIGSYVGSRTVKKVFPLSKTLVATMAGGAADCAYWIRRVARQLKIHELDIGPVKVEMAARLLAGTLREYRGAGLSVGTMVAGFDQGDGGGPALFYVDSEGTCISGDLFCVGSGSSLAYSVLDGSRQKLTSLGIDEAVDLAAWAVRHAAQRDSFSGGFINVLRVNETGVHHLRRTDARDMPLSKRGYL